MKPITALSFFPVARYLGCITFIVVGCVFLYQGSESLSWQRINDWPSTEGVVEKAILQQVYSKDGSSYRPRILYRYTVDGKEHQGDKFDMSDTPRTFSQARDAQSIMHEFAKGKKVPVFYDPKDPSFAVLRRFSPSGSYQSIGLGVFALICGIFIFIFFGRSPKHLE